MNKRLSIAAGAALIVAVGALAATLLFSGQSATAAGETKLDKKEVEKIVYDYLMENPEVIIEAVQRLQAKEVAQEEARVAAYVAENLDYIEGPKNSFVAGNPEGDVTIVEFTDYHCTYCKQNLNTLMNFVEADGNIRLVLREFPALRGRAPSMEAAIAAMASLEQGKYMEFHLAMMNSKGALTPTRIEDIALSVGIDIVELNAKMKDKSVEAGIEANVEMAHNLGIDGTPGFVVGGQVLIGLRDKAELTRAVKEARSKAKS